MHWRKQRLGLWLLVLAYGLSAYWYLFRVRSMFHDRPVTITMAHWQIERGPPDGFAAVIKRYEELNPRVKVEQLMIPGATTIYPQWMRSNLAGDNGPDILEWGFWMEGGRDIPARYFAPLTAELAKPNLYDRGSSQEGLPWEDTFHDRLIVPRRETPEPGQIYGVSVTDNVFRLFCNAPLLREITGSDQHPKTFDDLRKILAQGREFSRRTGRQVSGFAGSHDHANWIGELIMDGPIIPLYLELDREGNLYLYGREALAGYLERRWNFERPDVEAGLQLMREVALAMKPGSMQSLREDALIEFFRGEALFIFSGTYEATTLRRMAPFKVAAMPMPEVMPDDSEVGRFVIGPRDDGIGDGTSSLYLNRRSAHPKEALDFLRFLTSVEGQQLFTDHSGWLPVANGVVLPDAIKEFRERARGYAFGEGALNNLGSEVNMAWQRNVYLLTSERGSVAAFGAAMDRDAPAAIRKDLRDMIRNTLLLVKPADAAIVAKAALAEVSPDGGRLRLRLRELEAGQTLSEGLASKMALQLEETRGTP